RLRLTGAVGNDRAKSKGDGNIYYDFTRAYGLYTFYDLGELVNEIKLRGGCGRTGNRPRYGDRDVLLAVGTTIGGTATPVQAGTLGDSLIKPETLTEIEAGADVTFLKRRLQFEGTWYSRRITDLLLQPATIPSGGITNRNINGGELSNKGVEAGLTAAAVQTRDVDLTL